MSALVRYFLAKGYKVAGYDRTQSPLTTELKTEGLEIVYEESVESIPDYCRNPETTLVVYTPAIPASHAGLVYFREHSFRVVKRAELLGLITQSSKGLCFAGTHGKTTTSSMAAHIFHESPIGCNAFLGGILRNYNRNLILSIFKCSLCHRFCNKSELSVNSINLNNLSFTKCCLSCLDIIALNSYKESSCLVKCITKLLLY